VRRIDLAAITFLQGVVACGTVWGFEDPIPLDTSSTSAPDASSDGGGGDGGGPVVETPPAPLDPTRTCVPRPPADWQGPLIVFEGTGSPPPEPPPCPTDYRSDAVYDGNAELVAPDATCTCECGAASGTSCKATMTFFADKNCNTPCAAPDQVIGTTCGATPAQCGGAKLKTALQGGSCAPNRASRNAPPPKWSTRGRVCAPVATTEAGCPTDQVATPTTGLPFTTNTYCIAKSGEDVCPDIYPRKRVYYAGISDARDCDCSCAIPQGGSCAGVVTAADNPPNCTGGPKTVKSDSSCSETKKEGAVFVPGAIQPGSCTAAAQPKGSATPTTPTTVCCTR